jgi:hypothetical protein
MKIVMDDIKKVGKSMQMYMGTYFKCAGIKENDTLKIEVYDGMVVLKKVEILEK